MNKVYSKREIRAIIGLGNPGEKYYKTRHSIGFRVLDALAEKYSASWQQNSTMSYASVSDFSLHTIYLIKPLTFMNNSGEVIPWLSKKGIKADQILVVHDELEKPFAANALRFGGSPRGHNGLRSIIGMIGQDFWRLRFGVGRPQGEISVADYVLQAFNQQEESALVGLIAAACKLIEAE